MNDVVHLYCNGSHHPFGENIIHWVYAYVNCAYICLSFSFAFSFTLGACVRLLFWSHRCYFTTCSCVCSAMDDSILWKPMTSMMFFCLMFRFVNYFVIKKSMKYFAAQISFAQSVLSSEIVHYYTRSPVHSWLI